MSCIDLHLILPIALTKSCLSPTKFDGIGRNSPGYYCEPASSQRHQIDMYNGLDTASTSLEPEGHQGPRVPRPNLKNRTIFRLSPFQTARAYESASAKIPAKSQA